MQALWHVHVGCARSTLARPASGVEPVLGPHVQRGAPPWPLADPALASVASTSRFRCSTELPYSPSRDGLSYLTKFLLFRLFRLFPLLFSFPHLPLRFDARLHASNRTTPVAASGHAIEAAEPFAISDSHHRLSRSQPQPSLSLTRRRVTRFLSLLFFSCSCREAAR
ncbi:hypothetical protein HDV64DRAFT_130542 [Trichoderma sp. TUCIM 5745]